ncbi:hypothetical protein F4775DRAFT_557031 [Biscogniauxia sp. FL1348]|nr:hypothetical protein F4775DRAFT_557031 [Biscogniauxia sp. FL1348]
MCRIRVSSLFFFRSLFHILLLIRLLLPRPFPFLIFIYIVESIETELWEGRGVNLLLSPFLFLLEKGKRRRD